MSILFNRSPKNNRLVAPLDQGKRLTEKKAVISERARSVFRVLGLYSVACFAFEIGKFGTKEPGIKLSIRYFTILKLWLATIFWSSKAVIMNSMVKVSKSF